MRAAGFLHAGALAKPPRWKWGKEDPPVRHLRSCDTPDDRDIQYVKDTRPDAAERLIKKLVKDIDYTA
jgi:hypothetical protein